MQLSTFWRNLLDESSLSIIQAALGVPNGVGGDSYYVDSVNGDSGNDGLTWATALATIDQGINKTAAGDTVWVAANHNEGGSAADIFDADVAGITIIGLGSGAQRPRIDFDGANGECAIGANNVTVYGLRFLPSVTSVLIGLDIETGVTGANVINCEWMVGEDGSGTDEFVKGLHLVSGNHDTVVKGCVFRCHVSASHATHAIHVDAASDRCVYDGNNISGPWATNGILEDAASADTIARNNKITVTGTGYGFVSTSTFAEFYNNRGAEDRVVNKLGQEFYPGLGFKVTKTEDVNTATSDDLFTLTGKVDILLWTGEVTNALDTSPTDYQITLTTLAGVLVAAGNIASAIVGHMFTLNADAGDTSLSTSTSAVSVAGVGDTQGKTGHLVVGKAGGSDVIKSVRTAGASGDAIRHDVFYMPLETGASLVAAA